MTEVKEQLRVRVDTIDGLRCYRQMPAKPEYPAAGIGLRSIDYDADMDGGVLYTFIVWVHVSAGRDLERAQEALDPYLAPTGASSVKAVVEATPPNLAGACDWVKVTGVKEGPRLVDIAGTQPLAIPIDVEVMSS